MHGLHESHNADLFLYTHGKSAIGVGRTGYGACVLSFERHKMDNIHKRRGFLGKRTSFQLVII